ncbi:hypothetical protein BSU04_12105 [Caballeronia sordidicola]|uniref:Uncharacterized protein n=1 Tax=Caballeronia sordidicola TaxID=196367 RepID=A0A226X4S9_CABSO|nr:hypothetical protein BSU04_12105 [Caballeronia sordidicola]
MRQREPIRKPRQYEIDSEFNDKTCAYLHGERVLKKRRDSTARAILIA